MQQTAVDHVHLKFAELTKPPELYKFLSTLMHRVELKTLSRLEQSNLWQ